MFAPILIPTRVTAVPVELLADPERFAVVVVALLVVKQGLPNVPPVFAPISTPITTVGLVELLANPERFAVTVAAYRSFDL